MVKVTYTAEDGRQFDTCKEAEAHEQNADLRGQVASLWADYSPRPPLREDLVEFIVHAIISVKRVPFSTKYRLRKSHKPRKDWVRTTPELIRTVLASPGSTGIKLARQLDISPSTVSRIRRGELYLDDDRVRYRVL